MNKDDRLNEDDRFRDSDRSTIKPLHAVLRALADGNMDSDEVVKSFADAESKRGFDSDEVAELLSVADREGYVESLGSSGLYRLTEAGRAEIGPMIEMDLRYV